MSFQVTILGCGASAGVPTIGNNWGNCDPTHPKNKRGRTSILIEYNNTTLLVDTSPDLREQLIRENKHKIDAVFYTHEHADHAHGIDDLRLVHYLNGQHPLPIYGEARCLDALKQSFPYLFGIGINAATPQDFKPFLSPTVISTTPLTIGDIPITPFLQEHGTITTLGFRIDNFAYSTDVVELDEAAFDVLKGIDTWVVDCLRLTPSKVHAHLDKTLAWIERVQPKQAFLVQMSKDLDYETLCKELPSHIRPSHDGLKIHL